MSLIKVLPEYLEHFTLTLHPEVRYVSSSFQPAQSATTGSMPLSSRPSKNLKNLIDPSQIGQNSYDSESPGVPGFNEGDYAAISELAAANNLVKSSLQDGVFVNVNTTLSRYMEHVNSSSQIARNTKKFEIVRFDPPFTFNLNTSVKSCIRNVLMPYYAPKYDSCYFSYTNYNSLNFFSGETVPSSSAIIYSNVQFPGQPRPYSPSGSFTFDFYINPRYTNNRGEDFRAGTILHLTSTYAISLVTGSQKDENDVASGFRILLQLSHSADIPPSSIDLNIDNNNRSYPEDLIFLSDDNSLKKNNWHHVCVRWGSRRVQDGTGSFIVDDKKSYFSFPSSSILPPPHVPCSALVVGNYFDGDSSTGVGDEIRFFNKNAGENEGVFPWEDVGGANEDPINFTFSHPLNAEIHDVKILNRRINDQELTGFRSYGRTSTDGLLFYLPPYFTKESRERDCLITPFQTEKRAPESPFNTIFSFGVGGYIMNLPNFLKEFRRGYYPRLWHLTASTIDTTVLDITANEYIYASGSTRKRNLTILPNDNGQFIPDYELLLTGTLSTGMSQFANPLGGYDLSIVGLNDMVPASSAYTGLPTVSSRDLEMINESLDLPDDTSADSIAAQIAGVTPENMILAGEGQGPILTIYQRTRDPSSNEISIFDISNLFYGNRILPESFYLTDSSVTGSGGDVRMTLRDNGRGSLYRADCLTAQAKWPNVGTILYEEGIIVIKSPSIAYFGSDEFEASFKGEQNIHILTVNIPAGVGAFNSSSNPQFKLLSASNNVNDLESRFVYISGLNLHDDNLNIIMRGTLAQPVLKREKDEILIRFKTDF